jgi:glyoxylase-like metal-dependent hydrolase (beta-lactamase superfamily II)
METSLTTIHTVTSSEAGLLSNSYIVEGAHRLVVIDPPMLLSDAQALTARIAALGKPLGAVIVTHAHPDHANGAIALPTAPIVALESVAHVLRETAEPKRQQWTPIYGDDYPQSVRLPDTEVADGDRYAVDEMVFAVRDLGEGECASMALWTLEEPERAIFIGDFVYPGVHGWLAEGRTVRWLAQLDALAELVRDGDVLYPGHGTRAGIAALGDQRTYLETFRTIVGEHAGGAAEPRPEQLASIERAVRERYPAHRLPGLVAYGASAVSRELAQEQKR